MISKIVVWSVSGALRDQQKRRAIVADIASGMPSYAVGPYFEEKEGVFDECDILAVGIEPATGSHIGMLAAKWMASSGGTRFLFIQTILLAERYHRTSLIIKLYRRLFECVHERGEIAPDAIAFKTYNPKSFAAMAVFTRLANVEMYPSIDGQLPSHHAQKIMCEIAEAVSPGCPFDLTTGVVRGAAQGRSREFYREMPTTPKSGVYRYFKDNLCSADRILCCLFFRTEESKLKMLQAFGVTRNVE